jgi:uncharacterized protein YdiU (UPF0061 family)
MNKLLSTTNPKYISRNHSVEDALHQVANLNDFSLFDLLVEVL